LQATLSGQTCPGGQGGGGGQSQQRCGSRIGSHGGGGTGTQQPATQSTPMRFGQPKPGQSAAVWHWPNVPSQHWPGMGGSLHSQVPFQTMGTRPSGQFMLCALQGLGSTGRGMQQPRSQAMVTIEPTTRGQSASVWQRPNEGSHWSGLPAPPPQVSQHSPGWSAGGLPSGQVRMSGQFMPWHIVTREVVG
jgi:hypothetical protein